MTHCLSNHQLDCDLVAPRRLLVRLFPRSGEINLQDILVCSADLDAVSRDRSAEDQGKEIVLDGSLLQVGNVDTSGKISMIS
jgi:hypothetical protein